MVAAMEVRTSNLASARRRRSVFWRSCQRKLSNAANMTHRGRLTTTYGSQDRRRHNILVLAQGIEP
jgi:hypothetical protein